MNCRVLKTFPFVSLLLLKCIDANAQSNPLPSPEQAAVLISTCALSLNLEVDGQMRSLLRNLYSEIKSNVEANNFKFLVNANYLEKFPEADRLKATQLYQTCILGLIGGKRDFNVNEIPDVIELDSQLLTSHKRVYIKAKKIIAHDAEIRAFNTGDIVSDAQSGRPGKHGGPGANGAGGRGGNGTDGGDGESGKAGLDASEIRLEAEEFVGRIRIFNSGQQGGRGGAGGAGGNGGNGGSGTNGRSGVFCNAGPGTGGPGGDAGKGGDGGLGGNGGNGGPVVLAFGKVAAGSSIIVQNSGGLGGRGGVPGQPGARGLGGPRGSSPGVCNSGGRGPGADGAPNNAGRSLGDGSQGVAGSIEVTVAGATTFVSGTFAKTY